MGEGTTGVIDARSAERSTPGASDAMDDLQRDIETIRSDLGTLVGELDRRRHEALDLRLQLRRHASAVTAVVLGVGALLVVHGLRVSHRRRTTEAALARAGNLLRSLTLLARTDPARLTSILAR